MFKKISRWLRSKTGKQTLAGILAALVIVAIVGQLVGVWDFRKLFSTLMGGVKYRCLPTCNDGSTPELAQDGKFLSSVSAGLKSFSAAPVIMWIGVPQGQATFEVGIFDGDSGRAVNGSYNPADPKSWNNGNWDGTIVEGTYTLYADPLMTGDKNVVIAEWKGNTPNPTSGPNWVASSDTMPNNAWYNITLNVDARAKAPSGHHFYRLEVTRPATMDQGLNRFKVRTTGLIMAGPYGLTDASFSIVGGPQTMNDVPIIFPQYAGNLNNPGPSNYDGDWVFHIFVPSDSKTLEVWDGDFDRGTSATVAQDTDDPNTTGKPVWAANNTYVNAEGPWGRGAPADDIGSSVLRVSPPVYFEIIDPAGAPLYTNSEPSGTEEWERFLLSTIPGDPEADLTATSIKPGNYLLHIIGLDAGNTVWIRANMCAEGDCLPVYPETACPRTIGYWKNNFNKIFGDGKGNAQETQASLTAALQVLGQVSPLYRRGINVQNPQPLPESAGPMTPGEALMILMRKDVKLKDGTPIAYPGGRDQYNSMLARALQQDLASWLNFTSGKIGKFMYIELTMPSGPYQGSLWDALQEAQTTVFTYGSNRGAPQLERAKDIGDQINNGNLGEDAPEGSCQTNPAAYQQKIPPAKQPPTHDKAPKAPKPPKPPKPTPVPPPDPNTCQGVRVNTYNVEVTNNPFYGIKFNYQAGVEIKNSNDDEFKFTLPADVVNGMTSMQLEAKAATNQGFATLECAFNAGLPCGPVTSDNQLFAFSFMGATDNGNGTLTLTFRVQNFSQHGLSHASLGLPAGAMPTPASGNYQSQVCPGW